ncbi:MAG: tetratricopeptide repeat-containing sensor histidine kinase [Flavobacteriaceae bacterium]
MNAPKCKYLGVLLFTLFTLNSVGQNIEKQSHKSRLDSVSEIASEFYNNDEFEQSIEAFLELMRLAEIDSNFVVASKAANNISAVYKKNENFRRSIEYAKLSMVFAEKSYDLENLLKRESKLGVSYLLGYKMTVDSLQGTKYLDSAQVSFENVMHKAEDFISRLESESSDIEKIGRLDVLLYDTYTNLSPIYNSKEEYDLAEKYVYKSLEYFEGIENSMLTAAAYNSIGNINLDKKDYAKAEASYRKTLAIYDSLKGNIGMANRANRADVLTNLSNSLFEQGKIESYELLEEAYEIRDELKSESNFKELAEVNKKYDVVQLKREQEAAIKAQEAEQNKFRTFAFIGLIFLLFLVGILLTLYRGTQLKQRNLELQLEKEALQQESELERLQLQSQNRVLNAAIDGREEERKLIAEILHDSVSSLLSSANLHLQASRQVYSDVPEEIEKSQRIIEEASEKIRNLSHQLISSVLLKFGLSYSIFDLCEKYSNSQIEIVSDINNVGRYEQSFEIKINNIIEELVNNILKHSNASEAIITIEDDGKGEMFVEIMDNGDGFLMSQSTKSDGLGLNQIRARVLMMEGKFNIESTIGEGTTISMYVPIVKRKKKVKASLN